jgi:CheY-like chemotaxis protein
VDERPVIVVVDDEADALSAILNALTRRFGGDYRVVSHRSARTALDDICAIKEKGGEIALVIADQRMPEMTGRDFLARVRSIMPMAKRALLVDWGDHDASPTILQACALGELDNYLYKPWSPAEVHLYPLIGEFLAEWTQIYRPPMELIHIIGDEQSLRSNEIRELLNRNGIPHGFHQPGSILAKRIGQERGVTLAALPTVFVHDGSVLVNPSDAEIMDAHRRESDRVVMRSSGGGSRPRRPHSGNVCRVGRIAYAGDRAPRHRRTGWCKFTYSQLSWLPTRHIRGGTYPTCLPASLAFRRKVCICAGSNRVELTWCPKSPSIVGRS